MAVDFGLKVIRSLTSTGSYVCDLDWTHVQNILGYNVYRAESPSDDPNDWYKINDKLIQVNYYQDRGTSGPGGKPIANDKANWYYKIIPVSQSGNEFELSNSVSQTFDIPLSGIMQYAAPTIRMRTHMMLNPAGISAAETCHFLVRKWAGEYCSCMNIRTRTIDSNCNLCKGTGYKGGYELVENIYCRVRPTSKQLLGASEGMYVNESPTALIATYPRLTDGDVIVRRHNKRFRVRNVTAQETQGYLTAQTFELERMQLWDSAYKISCPDITAPTQRQSLNSLRKPENPSVNTGIGGVGYSASSNNSIGGIDTVKTTRTGVGTGRGFKGSKGQY